MTRKDARAFLDRVLALEAAVAESSRELQVSFPALRALHRLSLEERRPTHDSLPGGISIERLAANMAANPTTLSPVLAELRRLGLVEERRCSRYPSLCDTTRNGVPCGKHHLHWLTEPGQELAEEWMRPYADMLVSTDSRLWLRMASRFRTVHHSPLVRRLVRRRDRRAA